MSTQTIMLILCIMLVVIAVALLLVETYRLTERFGELKTREAQVKTEQPDRVIVVRQKNGTVRLAYSVVKEENDVEEETAVAAAPAPVPAPAPETVDETEGVMLPKAERLTFQEKYEKLKRADKRLIDEFTAYVAAKEDCSKVLQTSALAYKYKKSLIAKATIRRETVVLNFLIVNSELNKKVRDENVKIKPMEVRLIEKEDLTLAKQAVDLAIENMHEEEKARLEKRREARRKTSADRENETEVEA